MKEYLVYKGDEFICVGTAIECAKHLGVSLDSFTWYKTPTGQKRLGKRKNPIIIERLEDEEE